MATFSEALKHIQSGQFAQRAGVKNKSVITSYKSRLYHLSISEGVRYPFAPTQNDLNSKDWELKYLKVKVDCASVNNMVALHNFYLGLIGRPRYSFVKNDYYLKRFGKGERTMYLDLSENGSISTVAKDEECNYKHVDCIGSVSETIFIEHDKANNLIDYLRDELNRIHKDLKKSIKVGVKIGRLADILILSGFDNVELVLDHLSECVEFSERICSVNDKNHLMSLDEIEAAIGLF